MYNEVLDFKTLSAVIAASPMEMLEPRLSGRRILGVMLDVMAWDGACPYEVKPGVWQMRLSDFCGLMDSAFGGPYTSKRVGFMVGKLGLPKGRDRDGFWMGWSREQADILVRAIGAEEVGENDVTSALGEVQGAEVRVSDLVVGTK